MNNSRIAATLWLLSIIAFVAAAAQREVQLGALILSTIVFALLMGLYLMFSDVRIAEALPQFTRNGGEYGLPGFLFLLYVILVLIAQITNPVIAIVVAGATLWVPVGLWSRNEEALTPVQAVAGLAVLLIPLGVDVVLGARPDTIEMLLRLGAFALPALLILLTTREQKSRLNFYFASAVLFIWYTVEFGAAPDVGLPVGASLIGYLKLALIVLFLYVVTLSQRLPEVGFTFLLNRRDWREVLINFVLFGVIAIPIGLITGFIKPTTVLPSLLEIVGRGVFIFLFIALPEEILFRGVIHRYLERVLRWSPLATLILSSVIFGVSHLNNPPNVGYYFILASIAGFFYGRTFVHTGKVVPAALVHLAVDWMWSVFFAG
ncbi:MAG: CPBP family intramembrane metalloprotease [Chloroflexi bacterium]|nr:CPBP family intramembrane metalloprotease [Chloroflexota bacterium]